MTDKKPQKVALTPRRIHWDFPVDVPSYWFRNSPVLTHLLDVYTLLVPDNEKYYIRMLQRCLKHISDPAQKKELHQFFRQETLHGQAHVKYWQNLRSNGVQVDRFTRTINLFLYRIMEPILPHRIHVAIVATVEHINAYFGHIFLKRQFLKDADPRMKRLFEWHFAEELEHKAVAHDALQAVYPGYLTRLAGGLLTFPLFYTILLSGTVYLLASKGELLRRRTVRDLYGFFIRDGVLKEMLSHIGRYLKPSFHPWDIDDYELAEQFFEEYGIDSVVETPAAASEPAHLVRVA